MATGAKNAKSQMTTVRIPHEVIEGIEKVKEDGESTAGFLVTAARGEIKRRLRRAPKEHLKSDPEQPTSTEAPSPKDPDEKPISPLGRPPKVFG